MLSAPLSPTAETGVVRTLTALNYEVEQQYSLTVVAADDGAPVMSSELRIRLTGLLTQAERCEERDKRAFFLELNLGIHKSHALALS